VGVAECCGPCVAGPGRECTAGATAGEGSPRVYYLLDKYVLGPSLFPPKCVHVFCPGGSPRVP
jgi:hypothetical protein